jgi:hypothetical protein
VCSGGETCATCPGDCGSCCGNGACDNGESCASCGEDCGLCSYCGDGYCDSGNGENCSTCPQDCNGSLPSAQQHDAPMMFIPPQCGFCGDGICNFDECCWQDCGGMLCQ